MDEEQLVWNRAGLIPGPQEREEEYKNRVLFCLREREALQREIKQDLPFVSQEIASDIYYPHPLQQIKAMYDMAPQWVPLVFHNQGLSPWHGGCAWIYTLTERDPTSAFLQLRRHFAKNETLWKLYSRDEILAHEMVHVARMAFEEPHFEEIFAYRTSPSRWRRWWGPLLQHAWEGHLFLLSLAVPVLLAVIGVVSGPDILVDWGFWLLLVPFLLFGAGVIRLFRRHRSLERCIDRLSSLASVSTAWKITIRLTDNEIVDFSRWTPKEIQEYGAARAKKELRWQVIQTYWNDDL